MIYFLSFRYLEDGKTEVYCESNPSNAHFVHISAPCEVTMFRDKIEHAEPCYIKFSVDDGKEFDFEVTNIDSNVSI